MASGTSTSNPKDTAKRALGGIHCNSRRSGSATWLAGVRCCSASGVAIEVSDMSVESYGEDMTTGTVENQNAIEGASPTIQSRCCRYSGDLVQTVLARNCICWPGNVSLAGTMQVH